MPLYRLVDCETGKTYPLEDDAEFLVGRTPEADLFVSTTSFSRRQFRLYFEGDTLYVEGLSRGVPTRLGRNDLSEPSPITQGRVSIFVNEHEFRIERIDADVPRSADASGGVQDHGAFGSSQTRIGSVTPAESAAVRIPDQAFELADHTIVGRDPGADIVLPHIQVSRQHAVIRRSGTRVLVQDLDSANGTFVDGQRIVLPVILSPGATIGIGPFTLQFTGSELRATDRSNNLQLEGRQLSRFVQNSRHGKSPRAILDDVTVVIRPHEFVCLLGPSGSGKSTLLAALSATVPASQGQVLINQLDLYESFDSLKHDIAVVPQRDILHDELLLEDALRYTARLRLPRDTPDVDINRQIDDLLKKVGLHEHRGTRLGQLSGGQRRRASLANELIADPGLLFLDEVTSGLDEHTDREMMRLFRNLAAEGRTVVCVTHSLANIQEFADLVVLLTVGGKLAFIGTPDEACEHFGIPRLGHVYALLEKQDDAGQWQQAFTANHRLYGRYVLDRLSSESQPVEPRERNRISEMRYWSDYQQMLRHQLPILLGRYWKVYREDKRALCGLIMQVVIVSLVLYFVFGNVVANNPELFTRASRCCSMLFVLGVSSFWFGCNNAVKEIVKERPIYTKELRVKLDPSSYFTSKLLLNVAISVAQSLILLLAIRFLCHLPGGLIDQSLTLTLAALAGVTVGLFLSTAATSETAALTLVPLVLIPQIILSDVFVELQGFSMWLGRLFVSNYWIYGALRGTLPSDLEVQLNPPLALPLPFSGAIVSILVQVTLLIVMSIGILHTRDRVMACSNKSLAEALDELPLVGRVLSRICRGIVRQRNSRNER